MSTTMVRVSKKVKDRLDAMASRAKKSHGAIVEEALDALERRQFHDSLRAAYESLKRDPVAWQEHQREMDVFEGASGDGLVASSPRGDD